MMRENQKITEEIRAWETQNRIGLTQEEWQKAFANKDRLESVLAEIVYQRRQREEYSRQHARDLQVRREREAREEREKQERLAREEKERQEQLARAEKERQEREERENRIREVVKEAPKAPDILVTPPLVYSNEVLMYFDGKYAVARSAYDYGESYTIKIRDSVSGADIKTLSDRTGEKRHLVHAALSQDGKTLLTGYGTYSEYLGWSAELKVWDLASGREIKKIPGAYMDAYSADAKMIAVSKAIVDTESGKIIFSVSESWNAAAFSPNGRILAAGVSGGDIQLYDIGSKRLLRTLKGHSDKITCLAFSADGNKLASASADKTIGLWDAATGKELATIPDVSKNASVIFGANGKTLVFTDRKTVTIYDIAAGKPQSGFSVPYGVAFLGNDGRRILITKGDDEVDRAGGPGYLWNIGSRAANTVFAEGIYNFQYIAASPDGKYIAATDINFLSGYGNNSQYKPSYRAVLFAAGTGEKIREFTLFEGNYREDRSYSESEIDRLHKKIDASRTTLAALTFSPDGKKIANGDMIYDTETGTLLRRFFDARSIRFSPDGKLVAARLETTGGQLSTAVYDTTSGEKLREFAARQKDSHSGDEDGYGIPVFSPDGKMIAVDSAVWNAATGEEIRKFSSKGNAEFSADGKFVRIGGKLWNVSNGREVKENVSGSASRPNGKLTAAADESGVVFVRDAASGRNVKTLIDGFGAIKDAATTPHGKIVTSGVVIIEGTPYSRIKIWDITK
jgi:WD40 repeat protein